jgi:hypothetical protein
LKKQTGIWVDAPLWEAYRNLCGREKLRPSEPIEEYLRLVLQNGSASTVLNMMRGMADARSKGFEAYVRVLLNLFTHEMYFIEGGGGTARAIEPMLLDALKSVEDAELRQKVEEAFADDVRKRKEKQEAEDREREAEPERHWGEDAGEDEDAENKELSAEELQEKMSELKRLNRTLFRNARTSKTS